MIARREKIINGDGKNNGRMKDIVLLTSCRIESVYIDGF